MLKVELITMHRVKNYGSVLQAYATQFALEKLGYEVEIIDYYPYRNTKKGMLERIKNQNKYLKQSKIIRSVARIIILPSYNKRFRIFEDFIFSNLHLSNNVYHSYDEISSNLPQSDYYLTGSDQVWNSGWSGEIDRCFFWDFDKITNKKKIAYSASFGKLKLDDCEEGEIRKLLKKYDKISLRENSGVNICNDLGIENTIAVLDPTLLLTGDEWRKISSEKHKNEKYILVYNLNRNKKIDKYAKKLSKKTGLRVKYLSYQLHEFYKFGKMYCNPPIEEFLDLIDNATYIITDSFHAAAFSLNFNKEFIIVYPEKYSTRLQSILELLDLENRVAKDENDMSVITQTIDYSKVNKKIAEERKKSNDWLKGALHE